MTVMRVPYKEGQLRTTPSLTGVFTTYNVQFNYVNEGVWVPLDSNNIPVFQRYDNVPLRVRILSTRNGYHIMKSLKEEFCATA